jgi:hypothetical protein
MSVPAMGRAGGTRVVVFESAVDALHQPGGMIYDEMRSAAREVAFLAKLDAPVRTGELAAGIRVASENRVSRKKVGFYVRADAPHSYWVHEGTGPQIYPSTFPYMRLPAFPEMGARGTAPRMYRKVVAGQVGQPFLTTNLRYVMAGVAI